MSSSAGSWLSDPRGNPSRWVALVLAFMFALGAIAAALLGEGYPVTAGLLFVFLACFDTAFGRRSAAVQVASVFVRGRGGHPQRRS
jgi:hypothetical protein